MKKYEKVVVIVGSGLATRLYPITNVIPKMLVNFGHDTALKQIIEAYDKIGATQYIITVNSESHKGMVLNYIKQYIEPEITSNFIVEVVDEPIGSLWAIAEIVHRLPQYIDGIMYNWSDIIPDFSESNFIWGEDAIYVPSKGPDDHTNYGCRYSSIPGNNSIVEHCPDNSGNVVGVYQTKYPPINLKYGCTDIRHHILSSGTEVDFIEYFIKDSKHKNLFNPTRSSKFKTIEKLGYIDIGDFDKIKKHNTQDISQISGRSFNKISIDLVGCVVVKTALNDRAKDLAQKELEWYWEMNISREYRPKIFSHSDDRIVMEYIKPSTVNKDYWPTSLISYLHTLVNLHTERPIEKSNETTFRDIGIEVHKMESRFKEIQYLVDNFENMSIDNIRLNGRDFGPSTSLAIKGITKRVSRAIAYITSKNPEWFMNKTGFIHGDTNLSNMIITEEMLEDYRTSSRFNVTNPAINKTKVIDPRGYFGDTAFIGLLGYDYLKMIYGFSGYDEFNSSIVSTDLSPEIVGNTLEVNVTDRTTHPVNSIISCLRPLLTSTSTDKGELLKKVQDLHESFVNNHARVLTLSPKGKEFDILIYLWLGVIWFNLSGYFSNNPYKALVAYYTGLDIISTGLEYFEELYDAEETKTSI